MNPQTEPSQTPNIANPPASSGSPRLDLLPPPPPGASASLHDSSATPPAATRRRPRNGKIARLPYLERDMVNRLLRNNIPYEKIVAALEKYGYRVNHRNISNWRIRGGYKEWCLEQDRGVETRLLQDNLLEHFRKNNAIQIPEVGLQLAATSFSRFFANPDTQRQLAADPGKYVRAVATLCRLAGQMQSLEKCRDKSAGWMYPGEDPLDLPPHKERRIEATRKECSSTKSGKQTVPHRNYLPRNV